MKLSGKVSASMWILITAGWALHYFADIARKGHDSVGAPVWLAAIIQGGCFLYIAAAIWRGCTRQPPAPPFS